MIRKEVELNLFLPSAFKAFKAVLTNLNATGRYGPTSLGSHYTGQDHDGQVTLSSGIQQWTVPYTSDYKIEAIGAAGGYDRGINSSQYRGGGARMIGTFRLNKGEVIQILVGQEGGINMPRRSSGGGGGTFVVRGADSPLIIAGGGGGTQNVMSRHTTTEHMIPYAAFQRKNTKNNVLFYLNPAIRKHDIFIIYRCVNCHVTSKLC